MKKIFAGLLMTAMLISCTKNKDVAYPDFDYQTVYFASQFPVRTIVLGEDLMIDNSLDNEHKVNIKATIGGTRDNRKDVIINFEVDESLCSNLYFSGTGPKVVPMPSAYYKLVSDKITIPAGSILGGVEVQLTDAFFADPLSLVNTYVIPLTMKNVENADSILRGTPSVSNPNRCIDAHWTVKPRDFIAYAVKYVNPWHGSYLRRGKDVIVGKPGYTELDRTVFRRKIYVEQDEVKGMTTRSLSVVELPLVFTNSSGGNIPMNLLLTFDPKDNTCSISAAGSGYTASGTGKFVKRGEKNSWGAQDRDAIYLSYTIDHPMMQITSADTLVLRDRGVSPEYYSPVVR
ncbi:DUF5627 domain-containing protein [Chitinophaga tropicalis]|uniref:DUF1735 domain-containing protein n=1 Tax=Chitinophaga tropicalis TaxID=2683588 RepID=A0A7K1U339_9BACT|nr:DUF5627 domain-containing protein [Chitinophaga tropicalis]MVT08769.1 DUF1735 domain-containing protein [Chitinophaga tropicalis]